MCHFTFLGVLYSRRKDNCSCSTVIASRYPATTGKPPLPLSPFRCDTRTVTSLTSLTNELLRVRTKPLFTAVQVLAATLN